MAQLTLIFVCFLSLIIYSVTGCLPTSTASSSGGEIPIPTTQIPTVSSMVPTTAMTTTPTTTTTKAPCDQKENLALFYHQEDVDLLYRDANPVSSCLDCDGGHAEYFESAAFARPGINTNAEIGPVGAPDCPNLCVCGWDGECFRPTSSTISVSFYPYCNEGTCAMYVLIRGDRYEGLRSTTTSTVYTAGDQRTGFNPGQIGYKVVTDPSYFTAKSVGCSNCSPTSCSG
uniref:Secreted protein n=1 Tax=Panagrellus redivivus TaxID=6233 RepID=A0A7E4WCX1_PANRE